MAAKGEAQKKIMQTTKSTSHKKVFGAGYHAGVASKVATQSEGVVGSSFHNFTDKGEIHNQGRILSEVSAGKYMVQFYSFLDGRETTRQIFSLAEIENWTFYPSDEEMNVAYESSCRAKRLKER